MKYYIKGGNNINNYNFGIFSSEPSKKYFIIGDIHGDYQCLIHCLTDLAKVCSISNIFNDTSNNYPFRESLSWISSNNSIIIFTGDLIHRKRFNSVLDDECSDIYIIETLLRLKEEAKQNGGDIIIISGNHEIMGIYSPEYDTYTSQKNKDKNDKYFENLENLNKYIQNSYAWIKLDDILIAHGGLCSDYLSYLNDDIQSNNIIEYVNKKYREFFSNKNFLNKTPENKEAYNLFIKYENDKKHKHNMFWCREWGYSGLNCDDLKKTLNKVNCNKIIIAHCPQFLHETKPQSINFECDNSIARIDLGMSRCFEFNEDSNFIYYLQNNYYRKMAILQLSFNSSSNSLEFNTNGIITHQLSCLQYLLIKYGINKQDWLKFGIDSNWLGFDYIQNFIIANNILNNNGNNCHKQNLIKHSNYNNNNEITQNAILCLLNPVFKSENKQLPSILQFISLTNIM